MDWPRNRYGSITGKVLNLCLEAGNGPHVLPLPARRLVVVPSEPCLDLELWIRVGSGRLRSRWFRLVDTTGDRRTGAGDVRPDTLPGDSVTPALEAHGRSGADRRDPPAFPEGDSPLGHGTAVPGQPAGGRPFQESALFEASLEVDTVVAGDTPFDRLWIHGSRPLDGSLFAACWDCGDGRKGRGGDGTAQDSSGAGDRGFSTIALQAQNGRPRAGGEPGLPGTAEHPVLELPFRSQWDVRGHPADSVCLPTSLAMVFEFLGLRRDTAEVAAACYDPVNGIYGNWLRACMVAAGEGFGARVLALSRLEDLLDLVAAGLAPIVSVAFGEGRLDGAPIAGTAGHLLVVRGFDGDGRVLVCDPAARTREAGVTAYDGRQFAAAWKSMAIVVGGRDAVRSVTGRTGAAGGLPGR